MRALSRWLFFTLSFAAGSALAQSVEHAADERAIKAVIQEFLDARDANASVVSRAFRWAGCATWSARNEQPAQARSG